LAIWPADGSRSAPIGTRLPAR